jgi:3-oxoacyl-[acyl-carrier protein] reductase
VVVADAGITQDQLLALMSDDDFTSVLDTNLIGAYRVARRAVRAARLGGGPRRRRPAWSG